MSLPLDLKLLQSDEKFQQFCFRIAKKEFPNAVPVNFASWDGGRDIICFHDDSIEIVWQCKFTKQSIGRVKAKILESLDSLDPNMKIGKWILCISVNATGNFIEWLRQQQNKYKFINSWEIWDHQQLLLKLENYPDILEVFFYPVWKSLESKFRIEELELIRIELDSSCSWTQINEKHLHFFQPEGSDNDIVFDIILRNRGTIESLLTLAKIEIRDSQQHLLGLPGEGLLFPQVEYSFPLNGGQPGKHTYSLEPPLIIEPKKHQRFKIRLTETDYAWTGYIKISFPFTETNDIELPWIFLTA